MKFAHIADCHLGSWREPKLQELNLQAFNSCIDKCIEERVDFIIIAGDLFDTSMPNIDILKAATGKFKQLADAKINCYIAPGSHDYSASGKTFLDVLEKAGLCENIARFDETDKGIGLKILKKDNLAICGLPGKKAGLEKNIISNIVKEKLNMTDNEFKILVLHTTVTESKPKGLEFIESTNAEDLPEGFDYYALGHIHKYFQKKIGNKLIVYPGPVLPNNFVEFEEIKKGSFCIVNIDNIDKKNEINIEKKEIKLKEVENLFIDANKKSPEQITHETINKVKEIKDKIITLRISGELIRGKTSDIDFNSILEIAQKNDCLLLRNTSALTSPEFKVDVEVRGKDIEQIEHEVIVKYIKEEKDEFKEFSSITQNLTKALNIEKKEGETNNVFEKRVFDEISNILGIS